MMPEIGKLVPDPAAGEAQRDEDDHAEHEAEPRPT